MKNNAPHFHYTGIAIAMLMPVLSLAAAATHAATASLIWTETAPSASGIFFSTPHSSTDGNIAWRNLGNGATDNRWIGSNFTVSADHVLQTITFRISSITTKDALVGTSATLSLLDMGDTAYVAYNGSVSPESIIRSYTTSIPADISAHGYLTFDIGQVQITATKNYAFLLSLDGPGTTGRAIGLYLSNNSSVTYGFMTHDQGGSYVSTGAPVEFSLHGYAGTLPPAVPEPAAVAILIALAALGASGLSRCRRD
ncbi:MAG: PEP-CTERM sorting domain-containing protein [Opitutaceae bacterium]|jgi:hypothetical protein|nr:PEP-CTERM sorting domain-containing protein [Opitutaceae bacterium]